MARRDAEAGSFSISSSSSSTFGGVVVLAAAPSLARRGVGEGVSLTARFDPSGEPHRSMGELTRAPSGTSGGGERGSGRSLIGHDVSSPVESSLRMVAGGRRSRRWSATVARSWPSGNRAPPGQRERGTRSCCRGSAPQVSRREKHLQLRGFSVGAESLGDPIPEPRGGDALHALRPPPQRLNSEVGANIDNGSVPMANFLGQIQTAHQLCETLTRFAHVANCRAGA